MRAMTDDARTSTAETSAVCPWCSTPLPAGTTNICPSCGANLTGAAEEALPGLTAVDPSAIVRSRTASRPRSRLLSWLSGDTDDESYTKAEIGALEPPALDVRREMLRLELEAEVANLKAENDAILAEAAAEGRVVELPPEEPEADEADDSAEGGAAEGGAAEASADTAAAGAAATDATAAATDAAAATTDEATPPA